MVTAAIMSVLLLLIYLITNIKATCTNGDNMTCSLGGQCMNNKCICQPTWKGDNCEILNLIRSDQYKAFYRSYESSWGGSVIYSSKDNLYHMYAADMAYNCGLNTWKTNSRVVHVTSTTPNGPYNSTIKNIVIPIFAHNPTIQQNPSNGEYVIYHIGYGVSDNGPPINCSSNNTIQHVIDDINTNNLKSVENNTFPNRAYSSDLNNLNWTILNASKNDFEYNNPQAYIYENGSILMVWSRTNCEQNTSLGSICFGIAMSEGFDKPFYWKGQMDNSIQGEDGYFWRDINGNFHMIYHTLRPNKFGAHAFSPNGIDWYLATKDFVINPAFPFYYNLTNGTDIKLKRRERTQILLDKNGMPAYMFNGVQPTGNVPAHFTYTGVQPINTSMS